MGIRERVFSRKSAAAEIDLREHVLDRQDAPDDPTPRDHRDGYPDDCPHCGGIGYLDRIDLQNRRQFQHCRSCKAEWSVAIQS